MLYDALYESQMWMLYDSNKRHISSGDLKPQTVKLAKGDYQLQLQIRHDDLALLARAENIFLQLDYRLKETVSLDVYGDINKARYEGSGARPAADQGDLFSRPSYVDSRLYWLTWSRAASY